MDVEASIESIIWTPADAVRKLFIAVKFRCAPRFVNVCGLFLCAARCGSLQASVCAENAVGRVFIEPMQYCVRPDLFSCRLCLEDMLYVI